MVPFETSASFGFPRSLITGLFAGLLLCTFGFAQDKPAANPDVLILANGDTLHGKFVSAVVGKVTFHSDPLGDITLDWDKIKELHAGGKFAVLDRNVRHRSTKAARQVPLGSLDVANQTVTVHPEGQPPVPPVPQKNARYIVDQSTLNKEIFQEPNFFSAWNGSATAGATLVQATQNQSTISGALGLVRLVPTVTWLDPRNRTSFDFTGSYGRITQPAYVSGGVLVPSVVTKTSIYHIDGERDQYFSPRFFALAQLAYDHNFAQDLQLQQIYGGGLGWTALKLPKEELDLRATVQYEKQQFISGVPSSNQDLIGSTFSVSYLLRLKLLTLVQNVSYIPAYNNSRAYSTNETDTVTFPAYKRLGFSVGTIDTYLNDPPLSAPPTKRNSFQFTMGLTYAIQSKY